MTIVWCGTLAILLRRLRKPVFRVEKISCTYNETVKRYDVYYMCIDDLPL